MEENKEALENGITSIGCERSMPFIGRLGFGNRVESKATAMQYAIETATSYDENGSHVNKEEALAIYKMFTDNMELPDVPMADLMNKLSETIQELREKLENK